MLLLLLAVSCNICVTLIYVRGLLKEVGGVSQQQYILVGFCLYVSVAARNLCVLDLSRYLCGLFRSSFFLRKICYFHSSITKQFYRLPVLYLLKICMLVLFSMTCACHTWQWFWVVCFSFTTAAEEWRTLLNDHIYVFWISYYYCVRLGPGIESWWGRDFPHLSRLALGPTQPPVQLVPGLSQGERVAGAWRWPLTHF